MVARVVTRAEPCRNARSAQRAPTSSPDGPPSSKTSWRYWRTSVCICFLFFLNQTALNSLLLPCASVERHRRQTGQEAVAIHIGSCSHQHHSDHRKVGQHTDHQEVQAPLVLVASDSCHLETDSFCVSKQNLSAGSKRMNPAQLHLSSL